MKKISFLLAIILLLAGCSMVKESMLKPVDESDTTPYHVMVDEDMSLSELGDWLNENELVASKRAFINYMLDEELDGFLQPGDYVITKSMSLPEIAALITEPPKSAETISLTIQEGRENREIAAIFEEAGLFSAEEFLQALREEDFDYDFLEGVDQQYGYEGYLFPDTYEFYVDTTPEEVIKKMLDNFDQRFTKEMRDDTLAAGMTIDDVVRLASIIEREGADYAEFPIISSVFHNRLDIDMKLQSCATVQFIIEERKVNLTYEEMGIDSPFNTYVITGLPPSAIANPGLAALEAAIYPADTNYFYFVAKGDGENTHYFAETYEEHQRNVEKSGDL